MLFWATAGGAICAPVDDAFFFVDTKVAGTNPTAGDVVATKPWTIKEKQIVRERLATLLKDYPTIIHTAGGGRKIRLYRTNSVLASYEAAAGSLLGGLLIGDQFFSFDLKRQLDGLLHEFMHCMDSAEVFSCSKEWVDFAAKKMSDIRLRAAILGDDFAFSPEKEQWPSLYAATNLQEALSVYATGCVLFPRSECPPLIKDQFLSIHRSPSQLSFISDFAAGAQAYFTGNYEDAVKHLTAAISSDPSAATPHVYLACTHDKLKNPDSAYNECEQALKLQVAAGVPSTEPSKIFAMSEFAKLVSARRQLPEMMAILNEILHSAPRHTWALNFRAQTYEYLGRLSEAAEDYYLSASPTSRPVDAVIRSGATTDEVLQLYDQLLTKGVNPRRTLSRGQYFYYLAKYESNKERKTDYYRRALADFLAIANNTSIDTTQALFGEALCYCNLSDTDHAKQLAPNLPPREKLVIDVYLDELAGQNLEARSLLHQLK